MASSLDCLSCLKYYEAEEYSERGKMFRKFILHCEGPKCLACLVPLEL